jgi:hypothetical protein
MPISDKSRKILWGRSGNRCAICRHELVVDATDFDADSVVGEECHIISGKGQGPRYDPALPSERIDEPDNLILLCRVHHKMVDDQCETYTPDLLRRLKMNHEGWVAKSLSEQKEIPPVRLRRIKENIPDFLVRVTSGQELMNVISSSPAYAFEHAEPTSENEMSIVSSFLQEAQDWGELSWELEAGQRVEAAYRMSNMIKELETAGFWVFGGREVQRLEGGIGPPSAWPVAHLRVIRATDPEIIKITGDDSEQRASAK